MTNQEQYESCFTRLNALVFKAQYADKLDVFGDPRTSEGLTDFPNTIQPIEGAELGKVLALPLHINGQLQKVKDMLDAAGIRYELGDVNAPLPGEEHRDGKLQHDHIMIDLNQPMIEASLTKGERYIEQQEQNALAKEAAESYQQLLPNTTDDQKKDYIEEIAKALGIEKPLFKGRSNSQPSK